MFKPKKYFEEIDYTISDSLQNDLRSALGFHYEPDNEIEEALKNGNMSYMQENSRNISMYFVRQPEENIKKILQKFPQETLDGFQEQLKTNIAHDKKVSWKFDELEQPTQYSETNGEIRLQSKLINSINDISNDRFEEKKDLLRKLGFKEGSPEKPFDDFGKKSFYEVAYGVEYNMKDNPDGTKTLNINDSKNEYSIQADIDSNGMITESKASFDHAQPPRPTPEQSEKNRSKLRNR